MRRGVRKLARRAIYRFLPRGTDLFQDISHHLPALRMDVVFDVGANTGQSAMDFLDWFPGVTVYCFEPVADTFRELRRRMGDRVRAHQLALGATAGTGTMVRNGQSELARLVPRVDGETEVVSLDDFCREAGVERISYLKVDTEGGDLDVLTGGERLLADHRIDLVQVEAGMNRRNDTHVPFEALKEFLEARQYFLFGLYEQVPEWPTGQPYLRRANAVFLSSVSMTLPDSAG